MNGLHQALAQENPLQIVGTINAYSALLAKQCWFQSYLFIGCRCCQCILWFA